MESEEQLAAELSQLSAWAGSSKDLTHPHDDPYVEASIVLGGQAALPVHSVDQRENRKLVMKRKVLRHRPDGGVEVSDESVNTEPKCCANLWSRGHPSSFLEDTISEGEFDISSGSLEDSLPCDSEWLLEDSPCSPLGDSPCSLLEDRPCSPLGDSGSQHMSQYSAPSQLPTSYIVPPFAKVKKTDRVAKFNQYRQEWERFSFPGEDRHEKLRLAVHKKLREPGLPERAPRRLIPNSYVVPTMKPREALRWRVRQDLAQHLVPRRYTS